MGIVLHHWLIAVAAPAPAQPMLKLKINRGSRSMFIILPNVVHNRGVLVSPRPRKMPSKVEGDITLVK